MKQHITKEQWDELSDEQKSVWSHKFVDSCMSSALIANMTLCEFVNIGQMIEFLGDKIDCISMFGEPKGWQVQLDCDDPANWEVEMPDKQFFNEELCYALWEAVKYKLNNN